MLTELNPAGNRPPVAAFDFEQELVDRMPDLVRFARRLTRTPLEAEDLVQDCLERALRNRDKFEPGTNLHAWLCTILRNLHYTNFNRERRVCHTELTEEASTAGPAQDWQIMLREVGEAMDELTPHQRRLIRMVAIDGTSYQDAAAELQVSVGTIRSRLSRTRSELRSLQSRRPARVVHKAEPRPTMAAPVSPAAGEAENHRRPVATEPPAPIRAPITVPNSAPDAPPKQRHPIPLALPLPLPFSFIGLGAEYRSLAGFIPPGSQMASNVPEPKPHHPPAIFDQECSRSASSPRSVSQKVETTAPSSRFHWKHHFAAIHSKEICNE